MRKDKAWTRLLRSCERNRHGSVAKGKIIILMATAIAKTSGLLLLLNRMMRRYRYCIFVSLPIMSLPNHFCKFCVLVLFILFLHVKK